MSKFWIILVIIFTVPTFSQLLRPGFFFMQDDLQAMRVHQMFACFKDLQIPCRWVPDMGFQFGYPQFLFYPPSVYYLGAFIHLFGIQMIDSVKILFILGYIASALAMFIFLKAFFDGELKERQFISNDLLAFFGAMLYTYIPYKAVEVYVRGALSEFWSLTFYPLIFWAIYQLIQTKKIKYVVWMALSIAGLLLTHNLMSLIFAPVAIFWCVSLLILKRAIRILPWIILAGFLGIGLASFFSLPIIFEGKYAHLETLVGGYFDYRIHFVDVYRLFISNRFGYGSSGIGHDNNLSLSTGQIQWAIALLGVILSFVTYKKFNKLFGIVILFGFLSIAVLFLIHQKSSFIWEALPFMSYLQFPWRFLTVSIFLLSFLGTFSAFFISIFSKRYAKIFIFLIIALAIIGNAPFFKPKEWYGISDKDKFSGPFWEKELTISIFDYLPIYAKLPPNKKAPELPEVLEGQVKFIDYQKGSNYQTGKIEVLEDSIIRLPLFDFPGMEVKINNQKVNYKNNDCRGEEFCFGLITFNIPKGKHTISARLTDTPVRSISNIITMLSFAVILGISIKIKHEKNIS